MPKFWLQVVTERRKAIFLLVACCYQGVGDQWNVMESSPLCRGF